MATNGKVNRIELAGRSKGFSIDRIVVRETRTEDATWQDLTLTAESRQERLFEGQRYLWSYAWEVGGGWRYLEGFGYVYDEAHPWAYHWGLGWLYVVGTTPASMYYWDGQKEVWYWTSQGHLPRVYSFATGAWEML